MAKQNSDSTQLNPEQFEGTFADSRSWVSYFSIPKMDCPSEEQMIRMALEDIPDVQGLSFNLQ